MPKIIDHEKRKEEILKKAFALFSKRGYQNTSLSNLASVCRISRPTLYLYFNDKEDIFRYAIKQFTDAMISGYKEDSSNVSTDSLDKIKNICRDILTQCYGNEDFIQSLADFIIQMRHEDVDVTDAISRRTIRLKFLFSQLTTEGIKNGVIKRTIPVQNIVSQILALLQSFLFQIALVGAINKESALQNMDFFLENLRASS